MKWGIDCFKHDLKFRKYGQQIKLQVANFKISTMCTLG